MDENLIEQMKRDVRYAAVNGCPPPSDKYRAVIQRLRDDAVRRYRVHFDGSHSIPQRGKVLVSEFARQEGAVRSSLV